MEFSGEFTIENVTVEEAWLALSDPVMIKQALPGCRFIAEIEDPDEVDFDALEEAHTDKEDPSTLPDADPETVADRAFAEGHHYAAVVGISVGSMSPSFRSVGTIDHRELPVMRASGEGEARNSSFDANASLELFETEDGVRIEWEAHADIFGRIAQLGDRVIKPVSSQVANRFFGQIEDELTEVSEDETSLRDRIRNVVS